MAGETLIGADKALAQLRTTIAQQAECIEQLEAAARGVLEWYDRDGSTGMIGYPMEALRGSLDLMERGTS